MPVPNLSEQFPNNPDISSDITQSVIDQTNVDGFKEDPYSRQLIDNYNAQFTPKAIGPQGASLYPGLNHDINVGTQSGQIIGSQGVYVPGGNIMAVDPMLARRKAIDDAARNKAAALKPFDPGKPGELKDARFQGSLDNAYYSEVGRMTDEAKEKYGKDFAIVLQDPTTKEGREFIQSASNFEVMRRKFNQFVDLSAEMREGLLDKSKEYSPEIIEKLNNYEKMLGDFEGGDIWKSQDIDKMYKELEGHRSFEDYIQTGNFFDDISGITSGWGSISDSGEYYTTSSGETIKFGEAVEEVVDSLIAGPWGSDVRQGYIDRPQMVKAIRARLKDTNKFKKTAQQKTSATLGSETQVDIDPGLITTYADDQKGVVVMPTYGSDGKISNMQGIKLNSLLDAGVAIKGKSLNFYERGPDGKVQKTSFRGIPLSNPQIVQADGSVKTQSGTVYSEIEEFTLLDDGTIALKTKTGVPTTMTVKDQFGKDQTYDSFTIEDKLVTIGTITPQGKFKGRQGMLNEIKRNLNAEQQEQMDTIIKKSESRYSKFGSNPKVDEFGVPIP